MTLDENKNIARRWSDEIWAKRNLAAVDELFAPDFVFAYPSAGVPPNLEGYKQFVTMSFATFEDIHCTPEDIVAEGDKVTVRWTWRGTHKGEFMGVAPTGKQVTLTGISILRIVGGKIVEEWGEMDTLGMLQQLGAFPPQG